MILETVTDLELLKKYGYSYAMQLVQAHGLIPVWRAHFKVPGNFAGSLHSPLICIAIEFAPIFPLRNRL